jgi:ABC-type multidrug transport system fused ATPase/permease subunit
MNNWTSPESHTPGNVSVEGNTDYKLAVDVRNVFFEYKKKVPILKDISIQIPKGMSSLLFK